MIGVVYAYSTTSVCSATDSDSAWLIRRHGEGLIRLSTLCRCGVDLALEDPGPRLADYWHYRPGTRRERERHQRLRDLRDAHQHRPCTCGLCEWCRYRQWRGEP